MESSLLLWYSIRGGEMKIYFMRRLNMDNKYRIVEGIGQYWNKRYELQEKYSYYKNGELVESWYTVFHSRDKELCEEALHNRLINPKKDYRTPFTVW